jgi:hypothetical protein
MFQDPATSASQSTIEILIAAFGAVLTISQGFMLFILGDMRSRIRRLEDLRLKEIEK